MLWARDAGVAGTMQKESPLLLLALVPSGRQPKEDKVLYTRLCSCLASSLPD